MTASMVFFKELEQSRHDDTTWQQQLPDEDSLTMTMAWRWRLRINNLAMTAWLTTTSWQKLPDDDRLTMTMAWWWPDNEGLGEDDVLTTTWQWQPGWGQKLDNNCLTTKAWQQWPEDDSLMTKQRLPDNNDLTHYVTKYVICVYQVK